MFLLSAFFISAVILFVLYLLRREKADVRKGFIRKYSLSAIVGIADAFQHKVNTALCAVLPSIICFPVMNGGSIAGATIVSVLAFHERMDKKQILGFIFCVGSIILMCVG